MLRWIPFLALALLQILNDLDVVAADVNHVVCTFLDVAPDGTARWREPYPTPPEIAKLDAARMRRTLRDNALELNERL